MLITVGMPNLCNELHFWWPEWIFFWEVDVGFKETSLTTKLAMVKTAVKLSVRYYKLLESVGWSYKQHFPSVYVTVVNESSRETLHRIFVQLCQMIIKKRKNL